ncbi:MAG: zinc dependent phospholipase C family protein [Deltaproteobacteria bacterium]|nr:zinc dependent phospholipase C family protein [Deltaproteobacteria bacterium]
MVISIALLLVGSGTTAAFSVLGHQAVVDQAWDTTLLPELRRRFPKASEQDLADARAYARGGSHLPDLGYFPLGNRLFTDLLHYVRTGDFISRALAEANTPQEYAFALGALAHYEVDSIGHPQATNRVVPIVYPKLRRKYGNEISYAEKPSAHLQTEFRFDVLQVARRGEIPGLFEHSVDFKVPHEFLERLFEENYGLKLNDLFDNYDVALLTYRWGFRTLIHETTGITWELYREGIESLEPGITRDRFLHAMSRADFVRHFGHAFDEPGYFFRFFDFLGNLLPNIGPFTRLPYKPLPAEAKQLYVDAFHKASEQYRKEVAVAAVRRVQLPNLNLDTGRPDHAGEYPPADKAYAELLQRQAQYHFVRMPTALRSDMLNHFHGPQRALMFGESSRQREKTLQALSELRSSIPRAQQR